MSRAVLGVDGLLHHEGARYRVAIGKGGVRVHKAEGDGATPTGVLPVRRVLYRADRMKRPRASVEVMPLAPHDGWCDDPGDSMYNRPVRLPYPARHEELWRSDGIYDVIAVLGWNDTPPLRGQGSAIFLHVARPDYAPTEGCLALSLRDLVECLGAGLTELEVA